MYLKVGFLTLFKKRVNDIKGIISFTGIIDAQQWLSIILFSEKSNSFR